MRTAEPDGVKSGAAPAGTSAQSRREVDIEGKMDAGSPIRTRSQAECRVCGGRGKIAYTDLRDRLFGAPGEWTLRRCQDPACGLLWLDPMPVEEDLPRLYESYYTHSAPALPPSAHGLRAAVKHAFWNASYGPPARRSALLPIILRVAPTFRARLALQVFELQATESGRLLEVGCGSGTALERMGRLGWKCKGIDFDEKAVALARSRGLDVCLGGLEAQSYPGGTFDAVVMNHVIEHVPDPRALISECHRILKPGGQFACITPNAGSWCHSIFGRDWRGLEPPRHLHVFTPSSLRTLMQELAWKDIEVKSSIANTYLIAWSSWQLRQRGQLDMRMRPGLWDGPRGRLLQAASLLRILADSDTGEEIVVHAVK